MKIKIKKIIQNKKFIDIFAYVFYTIYLLFFIGFVISDNINKNKIEKQFENMILNTSNINKNISDGNFYKETEKKEEDIPAEPLFTDGKTALLSAYNKTFSSNSFYSQATGSMTTVSAGINVKVSMFTELIKYSNNKLYDKKISKVLETNAPSMLLGTITSLANVGVKNVKENNTIKQIKTADIRFENNIPVGNFNGKAVSSVDNYPLLIENFYVVSEDTIEEIIYFKTKYKNGVPSSYYVQAKLNPKKATTKYKEILKIGAQAENEPDFTKCMIIIVIDAFGYISSMNTIDEANIVKLGFDCPCTCVQNYSFSGFNEEIIYTDEDF